MVRVTHQFWRDINAQNRYFPARIGSLLVLVHLMALLPPHNEHKSRLAYSGLGNNVGICLKVSTILCYGTHSPVKTASTSESLRVIGDHCDAKESTMRAKPRDMKCISWFNWVKKSMLDGQNYVQFGSKDLQGTIQHSICGILRWPITQIWA